MGAPLPTAPAPPSGPTPTDLGSAALGQLRDRLSAAERRLQAIAPGTPGAREERAALDAEIRDLQHRLARGDARG